MIYSLFRIQRAHGLRQHLTGGLKNARLQDLQLMCIKMTVILLKLCKSFWIKTSEKGFTEKHLEEIANQLLQLEQFKHLS